MQTEKLRPDVPPPAGRGLGLTAAFLGAVTATGMTVILFVAAVVTTYLVAREKHADFPAVAHAVLSGTPTVDVVGAVLLSVTLFGAFFCGGYVAARVSSHEGRRQGFLAWLWALPVPLALFMIAGSGVGLVRRTMAAAVADTSTTAVCGSLVALALLGALAGGDTGQRARARALLAAADPGPAGAQVPVPVWVDAAPVAAAVVHPTR